VSEEIEYSQTVPTPNCPSDTLFINVWFGTFNDILRTYGMTYANLVHTFNRQMEQYDLPAYRLQVPKHTPMVRFFYQETVTGIKKNAVMVENGEVQTAIGNYYLPTDAPNDAIIAHMKNGRVFEPWIIEIANKYIKKGSTVLDIGANFGQMSLIFSKFAGGNGRVYSFEADEYIYYIFEKNIVVNNCRNIIAYNKAVYDESGKVMFYPVQDFKRFATYGSYGLNPNATKGRTIDTVAIDDLNISTPISFMKVDIQGSDIFAMRGAVETIKRSQMPIIFEFEERFQQEFKTSWNDYLNFINEIGYKIEKVVKDINYLIIPANSNQR
jgi:FkbM family methyltransferase